MLKYYKFSHYTNTVKHQFDELDTINFFYIPTLVKYVNSFLRKSNFTKNETRNAQSTDIIKFFQKQHIYLCKISVYTYILMYTTSIF